MSMIVQNNLTMENIKILEKHFKQGMKNKDFESFKRAYPTLLRCILNAMNEKDGEVAVAFADWMLTEPLQQSFYKDIEKETLWWHEENQRTYTSKQLYDRYKFLYEKIKRRN